ncbi:MAG: hypothetical protein HBSAPP03_05160 [Phycisphaerae bacterium]|nr:MAG: hypothetical protein HBSAPP03_05160 [Phycisphaerae bacterium]
MTTDRIRIEGLLCRAVVGLHEWERRGKQDVLLSIVLHTDLRRIAGSDRIEHGVNYSHVAKAIIEHVEASHRYTIEALATDAAGIALSFAGVERVGVRLSKPSAERYARAVEVEIERAAADVTRTAYIVLGSNDRAEERLPRGFTLLSRIGRVVKATSVHESPPAGRGPGANYLNAAAALTTTLPAAEVRRRLKAIERECGRGGEAPGHIALDLDLCLIGDEVIDAPDVRVPHPHAAERHYAAALLAMLDPALRHPVSGEALSAIAARLTSDGPLTPRPDIHLLITPHPR